MLGSINERKLLDHLVDRQDLSGTLTRLVTVLINF
jgi:hypothetical protein